MIVLQMHSDHMCCLTIFIMKRVHLSPGIEALYGKVLVVVEVSIVVSSISK